MFHPLNLMLAAGLVALTAALFTGCAGEQAAPPAAGNGSEIADENLDPEVETALAGLSPADRTAALKQGICPVSEKPLGSMGTPIKVAVDGQEVFVCCEGCVDMVKENPGEYLAKLPVE